MKKLLRTPKQLSAKSKSSFNKEWLKSVKLADLSMYASGELPCGCGGSASTRLVNRSATTKSKK